MGILSKLQEMELSKTERRIADYILEHATEVGNITISDVADACTTSKSMVVQLCKKAGCRGFKDLRGQLMIERALRKQTLQEEELFEDIHPGCSPTQVAQIIIRDEIRSLQDTADLMDEKEVERAVALLRRADRILLFGVGGSGVAALDLHNKLSRIGMNSRFSQDVHCQLLETSSLTADSVSLVISFTGRTKDMIDACELTREMGAHLITITRSGQNPVADASDVALHVASNESLRRVTATSSRLSTMSMVDVLFACLCSTNTEEVERQASRNIVIAQRRRK